MAGVRADDGALEDNLVVPQGSLWNRSWSISDSVGNSLTVTGWSVRAQMRAYASSALLLFEWNSTPGAGIGVATATGNTVQINLTGNTDSALWTFITGAADTYDVVLTDPSGKPTRIVKGTFLVTPSVTH